MAESGERAAQKPQVWFATGSVSVNAAKPILLIGWHEEDRRAMSTEALKARAASVEPMLHKYHSGQLLSPDELGTAFALNSGSKKPGKPQPFMQIFGRMVVTGETRTLLEGLDPGPLRFHPIEVLNAVCTAPLWEGADLHVMQVLTCRREVLVEESYGLGKPNGTLADGTPQRMVFSTDMHDALVVIPPSDGTAEMWLDDRLMGALFLSDRIAKALKAAKLTRGWGLKRCVVKTVH